MSPRPGEGVPTGDAGGPDPVRLEAMLAARPLTAVEWGLERTERMLARLGNPERSFRSLHVGGTNGKGSAAAMMASVLRRAGVRTGLYTSPELLETADRYRVDGRVLPRDLLERCAARVGPVAREEDATFFEAATVLAFLAFREAGVAWAAVEVGLGGRLDATNVLAPEVCAVTSVALEHTEYLGDTLTSVAGELAGIFKRGVPAVAGPVEPPARDVLEERAAAVGAPFSLLGREAAVEDVRVDPAGTSFVYRSPRFPDGRPFRVPLPGRHQAGNAGVALLALEQLDDPPPTAALEAGLESVRWRGRYQHVAGPGGGWVLDAGHNAAGIEALAETLREVGPRGPLVVLAAALGDKPPDMLAPLVELSGAVVLTRAPSAPEGRGWDPDRAAGALAPGAAEAVADFDEALDRARELAGEGTVVVTGSCYTVGDALRRLEPVAAEPGSA